MEQKSEEDSLFGSDDDEDEALEEFDENLIINNPHFAKTQSFEKKGMIEGW